MRNIRIAVIFVLCSPFLVTSAKGQMGPQIPTPKGIFNPVVGSGAQYEVERKDGSKTTFEIAIVGKESAEGKDAFWLEASADTPRMGTMVMKELIVVDGNTSHITRMVMLMPGRGPMELPVGMGARMSATQPPEDIRSKADDLGSESVTVPAGTFTCEHYRGKNNDGDAWVSKDVPPYGLVKMTDKDKEQTVVLTKTEKSFQDKITGAPAPFNPMMLGRPQP